MRVTTVNTAPASIGRGFLWTFRLLGLSTKLIFIAKGMMNLTPIYVMSDVKRTIIRDNVIIKMGAPLKE